MNVNHHNLSDSAFAALLRSLDPDLVQAAVRYERLREKLIRLFTWRGCTDAPELADETINRVATRVLGDSSIGTKVEQFSMGVAHRIFMEVLRGRAQHRRVSEEVAHQPKDLFEREATDPQLLRLEKAIAQLQPAEREMLLTYYNDRDGGLMANRRALQQQLGVSAGTLRIRVFRLRARLEQQLTESNAMPAASSTTPLHYD